MIQLQAVTYSYKKKQKLIDSIDLQLEQGKIYGLFGKNGAGKTTLLKLMSGLLFPHKGQCIIDRIPVAERRAETLSKLYLIPEEFELPPLTANKYIDTHAVFYGRFDHEQMRGYLSEFEIEPSDRLDRLSMGQRKKFMLAFGMAANTALLILDEPTNGLDIPSKSIFRKMLASSIDETRTVIISTHQARDLSQLIDHVLILEKGEMLLSSSIADIAGRLSCEQVKDASAERVLYAEAQLGSYAAVCTRKSADTDIDIELLFNAVLCDHNKINNALKN